MESYGLCLAADCYVHQRNDFFSEENGDLLIISYEGYYCVHTVAIIEGVDMLNAIFGGKIRPKEWSTQVYRVGHGSISDIADDFEEHTAYSNTTYSALGAKELHADVLKSLKDGTFNGMNL